jgi:hypothetical protein
MILLKWHLKKSVEGNVQDSPDTTWDVAGSVMDIQNFQVFEIFYTSLTSCTK